MVGGRSGEATAESDVSQERFLCHCSATHTHARAHARTRARARPRTHSHTRTVCTQRTPAHLPSPALCLRSRSGSNGAAPSRQQPTPKQRHARLFSLLLCIRILILSYFFLWYDTTYETKMKMLGPGLVLRLGLVQSGMRPCPCTAPCMSLYPGVPGVLSVAGGVTGVYISCVLQ